MVNRRELIERVAEESSYYKYEVEDILDSLTRVLMQELTQGNEVKFDSLFIISAPHNKTRKYFDAKSDSYRTSKGVRKLKIRPLATLKANIESTSLKE